MGEGATLPEKVIRARVVHQRAEASTGYDSEGNKEDIGLGLKLDAAAFVVEYGLLDELSLQVLIPYLVTNKLRINADTLRKSQVYQENYGAFLDSVAGMLKVKGLCTTDTSCTDLVKGGYALPSDTAVTLPSGEVLTVKAGVPVIDYADAIVVGGARAIDGRTGVGDIEIGVLYNVFKDDAFIFSLGGGVRLPTGSYDDVPSSQRATGSGLTDLGLRINLDYSPVYGIWLSWQNQTEIALSDAVKPKTSLLDNTKLNEADPTTAAAIAAGSDGLANEQTIKQPGARQVGFFKADVGFGAFEPALQAAGIFGQFNYDFKRKETIGEKTSAQPQGYSWSGGVSLSGLGYGIPASMDFTLTKPLEGKNQALAANIYKTVLRLYYKF